ncbi:MAG TPA: hypothetical protein VFC19_19015 [Candidatus Limnocylindrales bacterium]|nr:hypothetical protein [Candidatus Limnocylindrales bacterium]
MTAHLILDRSLWLQFGVPVGVDLHGGTPSVQLRKAARRGGIPLRPSPSRAKPACKIRPSTVGQHPRGNPDADESAISAPTVGHMP